MSDVATEAMPIPNDRGIDIAAVELKFDEKSVRGIGTPLGIVKRDAEGFAQGLSIALSNALGVRVLVSDVKVTQGTVTLKAKIVGFIIPIVHGAVGGSIANWLTQNPPPEPAPYTQMCETVRTTTTTYTTEYFQKKGYVPKTISVTKTTFQEVCKQVQRPPK